ncbi:hypothetical protein RB595_006425 [Gaeumannomyces hyphopodioides]
MPGFKAFAVRAAWLATNLVYRGDTRQQVPGLNESGSYTSGGCDNHILDPQPPTGGNWLGWGAGAYNNRWAAPDAVVSTKNIANLTKVCSVPYSGAGQSAAPLVTGGVAYYPTFTGLLVALDYQTCSEVWSVNVTHIIEDFRPGPIENIKSKVSRTTPALDKDGDVLFIGTLAHALVLAIDRRSGRLIDSIQLDNNPYAILTQSPTFYGGRLYAGVSSTESVVPPGNACCSFIGSFHAISLISGKLRHEWGVQTLPHTSPANANLSGAAVWGSQPSIDPIRRQVFFGSGNLYHIPPSFVDCVKQTANISIIEQGLVGRDPCLPIKTYQDSIMAIDLETGRVNWAKQLGQLDAWNSGCLEGFPSDPDACPETPGLDADFGMAPTFVLGSPATPAGQDIIVAGQKSGLLYALFAQTGTVAWAIRTGPGGLEGGLTWGVAVDDKAVYFTNTNSGHKSFPMPDGKVISNSAFGAASLTDGRILWLTPAPDNQDSHIAPTVVNDVVLAGTTGARGTGYEPIGPGYLTPLDKNTGKILRQIKMDAVFRGGIAAVCDFVLSGTGYGGLHATLPGSFSVWKV